MGKGPSNYWNVSELLKEMGYDPLKEMIGDARKADVKPEIRTSINKELLSYLAPKPKQVEHVGEIDHQHTVVIQSFKDVSAEEIERFHEARKLAGNSNQPVIIDQTKDQDGA